MAEPANGNTPLLRSRLQLDETETVDGESKWPRVTLGYVCCLVGLAALDYALLVWLGIGLDKQRFDAGTMAFLVATGAVGALLMLLGATVVRRARRSVT